MSAQHDKKLTGIVEDMLVDFSKTQGVRLDKDKLEFLRAISKTKYSGLPTTKLATMINSLKDKDEEWYDELLKDGLVEKFVYSSPSSKVKQTWEGWFITSEGRKILKEILNKM
jgi:hypothetical protein